MSYEWDPQKAESNYQKHGIHFVDAVAVLKDENALWRGREKLMNAKDDIDMREEYDFSQAKCGPIVPPAPDQTQVTLRIDTDTLNWFREKVNAGGGGSYQALINQALREYIEEQENDWETVLRRVVREELRLADKTKQSRTG